MLPSKIMGNTWQNVHAGKEKHVGERINSYKMETNNQKNLRYLI